MFWIESGVSSSNDDMMSWTWVTAICIRRGFSFIGDESHLMWSPLRRICVLCGSSHGGPGAPPAVGCPVPCSESSSISIFLSEFLSTFVSDTKVAVCICRYVVDEMSYTVQSRQLFFCFVSPPLYRCRGLKVCSRFRNVRQGFYFLKEN